MELRDTPTRWGRITILAHWAIAALVAIAFGLGQVADELPRGAIKGAALDLHASVGLTMLALLLAWRLWRAFQPATPAPQGTPRWLTRLAAATKIVLVGALLVLAAGGVTTLMGEGRPVALFGQVLIEGGARSGLLEELGEGAHEAGLVLLGVALTLHVAGALKHHLIDRDVTLRHMLGRSGPAGRGTLPGAAPAE